MWTPRTRDSIFLLYFTNVQEKEIFAGNGNVWEFKGVQVYTNILIIILIKNMHKIKKILRICSFIYIQKYNFFEVKTGRVRHFFLMGKPIHFATLLP